MPVERVSKLILKAVGHPRPRARYPLPKGRLTGWILPRILPARFLDRVVAERLGMDRQP
jgi:hypothetical protein